MARFCGTVAHKFRCAMTWWCNTGKERGRHEVFDRHANEVKFQGSPTRPVGVGY